MLIFNFAAVMRHLVTLLLFIRNMQRASRISVCVIVVSK